MVTLHFPPTNSYPETFLLAITISTVGYRAKISSTICQYTMVLNVHQIDIEEAANTQTPNTGIYTQMKQIVSYTMETKTGGTISDN